MSKGLRREIEREIASVRIKTYKDDKYTTILVKQTLKTIYVFKINIEEMATDIKVRKKSGRALIESTKHKKNPIKILILYKKKIDKTIMI